MYLMNFGYCVIEAGMINCVKSEYFCRQAKRKLVQPKAAHNVGRTVRIIANRLAPIIYVSMDDKPSIV